MKKWAGGLQPLADKYNQHQNRKYENHYRDRDRDINRSLQKPVERIFQRLFPESDKAKTTVLEVRDRMAELFLEITQDQQTNAELVAGLDDILVGVGEKRKLQEDHLSDSLLANHSLDFIRLAEHRNSVVSPVDVVFAN